MGRRRRGHWSCCRRRRRCDRPRRLPECCSQRGGPSRRAAAALRRAWPGSDSRRPPVQGHPGRRDRLSLDRARRHQRQRLLGVVGDELRHEVVPVRGDGTVHGVDVMFMQRSQAVGERIISERVRRAHPRIIGPQGASRRSNPRLLLDRRVRDDLTTSAWSRSRSLPSSGPRPATRRRGTIRAHPRHPHPRADVRRARCDPARNVAGGREMSRPTDTAILGADRARPPWIGDLLHVVIVFAVPFVGLTVATGNRRWTFLRASGQPMSAAAAL